MASQFQRVPQRSTIKARGRRRLAGSALPTKAKPQAWPAWGFYIGPNSGASGGMGTTARLDLPRNLKPGNKPLYWTEVSVPIRRFNAGRLRCSPRRRHCGQIDLAVGVPFVVTYVDDDPTTDVIGTTPLPAALPLFATGLGALGLLGWRRKRKNAAAHVAAGL